MSPFLSKLLSTLRFGRAGSRRGRVAARPRRRAVLALETLEDRTVPTVVFQPSPFFGAEQVLTRGTEHLSNSPVHLVFWGSAWHGNASDAANKITGAANQVLNSTYFDGLSQYGVTGGPHLDISTYDNNDPGAFSQQTLNATVSNATHNSLPRADTGDTGSNRRIYVVVTPPGSFDAALGPRGASGWNSWFGDRFPGGHVTTTPVVWCSTAGDINNFTVKNLDYFTSTFSHELAEIMTDPYTNGVHVSGGLTTPLANQIGDGEPAGQTYGYRLNGAIAQPYWSAADSAFIVTDGRANQQLQLTPRWVPVFIYPQGLTFLFTNTYTLNIKDYISQLTLDTSPAGGVQVNLNGEVAQFEPGTISNVVVTTLGSRDTIDIERTLPSVPIAVNLGSGDDTVILSEFAHQLDNVRGSITINGGRGSDTLRLDDSWGVDVLAPTTCTITSGGLTRVATTFAGFGPATTSESVSYNSIQNIELDGGFGINFFNVQSTPASSFTIKTGNAIVNSIVVGDTNHTLKGINGALHLIGDTSRDSLRFDDSQDFSLGPTTYTITSDQLTRQGLGLAGFDVATFTESISYSNIPNIELDGGLGINFFNVQSTPAGSFTLKTGNALNMIVVGDTTHTLKGISGALNLIGNGQTTLRFDDSQDFDLGPTTCTVTSSQLTREGLGLAGLGVATFTESISYSNIPNIELDGGLGINFFNVQSTPAGSFTIKTGNGLNMIVVGDTNHTLGGIGGSLQVIGAGDTEVTLDDSGNGAPTEYDVTANSVGWEPLGLAPGTPQLTFDSLSSLTVEGGSGDNTFVVLDLPAVPLTVNAGSGLNTLNYGDYSGTSWAIGPLAGNNYVFALSADGTLSSSNDGINWTTQDTGVQSLAMGNWAGSNCVFYLSGDGTLYSSNDGINWMNQGGGFQSFALGSLGGTNYLVALDADGVLKYSTGNGWQVAGTQVTDFAFTTIDGTPYLQGHDSQGLFQLTTLP